ncbi:hypothetical protein IGA_06356 [Bacillus cereus HuA3-9]|uniref:Uncharacterized protein n=2 Tax=Bacillus cereus group TaxID=86661 RepID=R8C9K3_BACCE|nr:hypothetical protein III_06068 [Bacillus mycoides]EOO08292.1 hypothetical protein IGA_06356 [Bacillus cereus HuA3-9]
MFSFWMTVPMLILLLGTLFAFGIVLNKFME